MGVPFLGEIPLVPRIRETSDAGTPVSAGEARGAEAEAFLSVAKAVKAELDKASRPAPKIVIE
jgi:ATP-binding protein involved in chromosome partitioning